MSGVLPSILPGAPGGPTPHYMLQRAQTAERRAAQAYLDADAAVHAWPPLHRRLLRRRALVLALVAVAATLTAALPGLVAVVVAMLVLAGISQLATRTAEQRSRDRRQRTQRQQARHDRTRLAGNRVGSRRDLRHRYAMRVEADLLYEDTLLALYDVERGHADSAVYPRAGLAEWERLVGEGA